MATKEPKPPWQEKRLAPSNSKGYKEVETNKNKKKKCCFY